MNVYLEKVAVIEHLAIPLLAHVAQNAYADKTLKSPAFHRELAHNAVAGAQGKQPGVASTGNLAKRFTQSTLVPELGVIKGEAHHAGSLLNDAPASAKVRAYRELNRKHPEVAKHIRSVRKLDTFSDVKPNVALQRAGKAAGLATVAVADAPVAVMNAAKMVMAHDKVKKSKFGQFMRNTFIEKPFKQGVGTPSKVENVGVRKAKDLVLGPIPGMARDAGRKVIQSKAGTLA